MNDKLKSVDQVVEARKRALRMLGAIYRNVSYKREEVIRKKLNNKFQSVFTIEDQNNMAAIEN